jgi:CRP-like cAMP-binding protein
MNALYDIYKFPLFAGCNHEIMDAILQDLPSRLSTYKPGDIIALQGSACRSLFLLCEGEASARMTNDEGKEIKVELHKAPKILAPAFIYGSESIFPVSIHADTDCLLWIISKENFLKIMEHDPVVLRNFLRIISDRSLFLSRKFNEFALQNLETRIISYLKKHTCIQNLQEVALILGVARTSLSRTIATLVEQGIIKKDSSGYILA